MSNSGKQFNNIYPSSSPITEIKHSVTVSEDQKKLDKESKELEMQIKIMLAQNREINQKVTNLIKSKDEIQKQIDSKGEKNLQLKNHVNNRHQTALMLKNQ